MGDDVEIRAVETLSDNHFPFRMYSFAHRRRDGARQELRREVYAIGASAVVDFPPWSEGVGSERRAAERMAIPSMLARASAGVR